MASVHKRPDSKYWHAAWRGSDGTLHLRSTKQINRSKALGVAVEWERVDKKVNNGEMVESQVRQVLNDILERAGEPPLPTPATNVWLREWLREKESSKAEGTAERYKGVVDGFIAHLGERANKPLTTIAPRDIQSFLTYRRKEDKVSATTINLDGKILRACFSRARKQGIISTNPAEAVDLPAVRSVQRGVFTSTDLELLLDAAKGTEWETVILAGYYTAARLSDCTRIEWENVDLVKGTLKYFEGKNQKEILMPLHPDLAAHLETLAVSDKPQKHLTPEMAQLGPGGRHGLSEGFKRIAKKAGLDVQTVQGTGVRKISKRTFHALRHSFTSALANAGVSPELRMRLTGHKSAEVHRGYTHMEMETLRDAIKKLPALKK
jgi:integrase